MADLSPSPPLQNPKQFTIISGYTGNTETEKSTQIKIDKAAPVTSIALEGTEGLNGWYNPMYRNIFTN